MQFRKILFVTGALPGQDGVLDSAVSFALLNRAHLTVLALLGDRPPDLQILPRLGQEDLWELVTEDQERTLAELVAPFRQRNAEISTEVLDGPPFLEVIREVIRNGHDLVIMPADGGPNHSLFGSLCMHLLRKCPCPVWILKATRRRAFNRIVVAVDSSAGVSIQGDLNTTLVRLGASLASENGSELHVVHAWTIFAERIFKDRSRLSPQELANLLRATEQDHRQKVHTLLQSLDYRPDKCHVHVLKGAAGEVVPQLARNVRADVMVMGTAARTGEPGFLVGSTAETILGRLQCSVFGVKPEGFRAFSFLLRIGPSYLLSLSGLNDRANRKASDFPLNCEGSA